MGVQAMLIIFVLFIATAKADGEIEFWGENVILTCPRSESESNVDWFREDKPVNGTEDTYTVRYEDKISKLHSCKYDSTTHYFFMKGKVCKNCFELDANLFGLVIVLDVIGTAIVMMIIYKCTKKKGSAAPVRSSKAPSHSGGPPPPTPSRDYEQLNIHTRSQDTYSIVNRTG